MKSIKSTTKIKCEFSLQSGTHLGGSKVLLDYLERIQLAQAFSKLSCFKAPHSLFPLHRILLYLIVGWLVGCQRLFHFRTLQHDSLVRRFLGGRCPHHSLLYKELARVGAVKTVVLPQLKRWNIQMISPCLPNICILDLDSTVETVYGNQEGAAVGVNAHKRGRKSYHPLLAYEGKSRFALNATLRAGNTHSATDAVTFVEQTLALLESRKVRYARFDKGFGGETFYSLFEMKHIGYVGKIKWTKRLQEQVRECRHWKRYVDEEWIIEGLTLFYKATSWDKHRRVCVIRKAPRFQGDQLLFDQPEMLELYWDYEAMVTTEVWESLDVWRFYNQRCCMENYIKEAKYGFVIDRISTSDFAANEIDLTLKLFAYNLFERFKKECCEPVHQGYTIRRFRQEFIVCAGVLVEHSRRVILKLQRQFQGQQAWLKMLQRVAALE